MNSRRRIGHASKPLCGQRISVRVAWERVVSRREANFLRAVASFAQSANGGPIATSVDGSELRRALIGRSVIPFDHACGREHTGAFVKSRRGVVRRQSAAKLPGLLWRDD